jgi:hypothetical protein
MRWSTRSNKRKQRTYDRPQPIPRIRLVRLWLQKVQRIAVRSKLLRVPSCLLASFGTADSTALVQ